MAMLAMPEIENQEFKLLHQPQHNNNLKNLQIRVLGVPQSGAKSRVETQIKLCLQLVTDKGEKVPLWSHLRLPEYMVAKEKLKTKNARNTQQGQSVNIVEKSVLNLEATVVCASEIPKKVVTCLGCVQRERKRSQRKKEHKLAKSNPNGSSVNEESNKAMDLDDEKSLQLEQRKILLFNCSEIVDFSSGDTILPTRITCYCRHHNEKIGFCIYFVMKDYDDNIIAAGMSPPIMITDDHKSSKTKVGLGRKRPRAEYDRRNSSAHSADSPKSSDGLATPPISAVTSSTGYSGQSSPVSILPLQTSGLICSQQQSVKQENNNIAQQLQIQSPIKYSNASSSLSPMSPASPMSPTTPDNNIESSFQMTQPLDQSVTSMPSTISYPLVATNPSTNMMVNLSIPQNQLNGLNLYQPVHLQQNLNVNNRFNGTHQGGSGGPMRIHNSINSTPMLRRTSYINGGGTTATMFQNGTINGFSIPRMSRLIPSEGPMYGGVEVTVLGTNFFDGLTCMFGDCAAIPTQYWGPNTLVCLLPPSHTPGPVIVSFKEFPISLLDSSEQELVFFNYHDDSDRALMELALQVVGMKMTGKLEDARNIAMRIVGGNENDDNSNANGQVNGMTNAMASILRGSSIAHNLEEHIMKTIRLLDMYKTEHPDTISLRNATQHSMLHFAAMLGYEQLAANLIERGIDINMSDRYGFTALHYAAWMGKLEIVRLLLAAGTGDVTQNIYDQYAIDLALSRNNGAIVDLIENYQHDSGVSLSSTSSDESSIADLDDWYSSDEEQEEMANIDDSTSKRNVQDDQSFIPPVTDVQDGLPPVPSVTQFPSTTVGTEENPAPHISWVDSETAATLLQDQEPSVEDEIVNAEVLEDYKKPKQPLTDLATASTIWLQKTFAHLHMPTLSKPNIKMPNINMPNLHNFSSPKFSTMTFTPNLSIPRPSMPSMPSLHMNIEFLTLPTVTFPAIIPSGFVGLGRDANQPSVKGKDGVTASSDIRDMKIAEMPSSWDHCKKILLRQGASGSQQPNDPSNTKQDVAAGQEGISFLRLGGYNWTSFYSSPSPPPPQPPVPMYSHQPSEERVPSGPVKHASRRVGYTLSELSVEQTAAYENYEQKIERLRKDRMLYLFWVPALLVMLALAYVRYGEILAGIL